MQVQKLITKTIPYTLATVSAISVATTNLNAANNQIKASQKNEIQLNSTKEPVEKDIPWLNIYTIGCIIAAGGVIKLGDYLEKKEKSDNENK